MLGREFGLVGAALLIAGCGSPWLPGSGPYISSYATTVREDDAGNLSSGPPPLCTDAGSSARPGACQPKFANGLNVAWVNYGDDVPNPDLATFDAIFNNTFESGGRVVRWWLHTDGTHTPGYDANGNALPLSCLEVAGIRSILDHAATAKVMVLISLWNYKMLDGTSQPTPTAAVRANNVSLLTNDSNRQAYIDNYLKPLVAAVAGHPGLYGWEIFNEPEGMSNVADYIADMADGGPSTPVDESFVQKTVNWFADAIHSVDPAALVTDGTWTFQANSDADAGLKNKNYYSDSALLDAGGRDAGVLDFYEVHYYQLNRIQNSPFKNNVSTWQLDKPVVIGEFDALDTDGVDAGDLYTTLYANGYAGAWAWKYWGMSDNGIPSDPNIWPSMQAPMLNLYDEVPNDINCP